MAEPMVIKFYSPVNEGGLAHEIRQQLFADGAEVISIQAGGPHPVR
jgi:hypothetical protein